MTPPGGRERPEPQVITVPWCPACHRTRFGMNCVECGGQLVLQEFVHRGAYDALCAAVSN
jgi:hypothetical protein